MTGGGAKSSLQDTPVQALGSKPGSLTKTWIWMTIHPGGALPLSSHVQAVGPHRILEEEYSGMDLFLKVEQSVLVCGKVLF